MCFCRSFLPWEKRRRDVCGSRETNQIWFPCTTLPHPLPCTAHCDLGTMKHKAFSMAHWDLGTLYCTATSWSVGPRYHEMQHPPWHMGTWVPCTVSTLHGTPGAIHPTSPLWHPPVTPTDFTLSYFSSHLWSSAVLTGKGASRSRI